MTNPKRIIWAFDPFDKRSEPKDHWKEFVENLAAKHGAQVEPVYVLSPDGLNWNGDFSGPWVKQYEPLIRAAAQKKLKKYNPEIMLPLKILVNPRVSLRRDVKRLSQYAVGSGASFVLIGTHGRKGIQRWMMGSFAESLLLHGKVPLLTVNPQSKNPNQIRRILFPTDLGSASHKAFKKVLRFCKLWKAELVLIHKLADPLEPIVQSGVYMAGGGWITLNEFNVKQRAERKTQLLKWQREASEVGVKVSQQLIEKPGLVVDSILEVAAKSHSNMIALSSQSGAMSSVVVGSVARQLLRSAPVPVLAFHGA